MEILGVHLRSGDHFFRSAWIVILFWTVLIVLALPMAKNLPSRLAKTSPGVPSSQSAEVRRLLANEFANPFVDPLIIAIHTPQFKITAPEFKRIFATLTANVRACPLVAQVASPGDLGADKVLTGADGHTVLLLVGHQGGPEKAGDAVKAIRNIAQPELEKLRGLDPNLEAGVTGPSAFAVDIIGRNAIDSASAERQVMLPALFLLLWAFASPLAALLPLVLGVLATILTLASAAVIGAILPLNGYVQTAGTMLGLALGIDYALIIVGRYRQERQKGLSIKDALPIVYRTAGWTVVVSGLVVLAAMSALIPSGLIELQSVGVGGALTVFWAALLATTLLPAMLVLLDPWLDAPHWLFKRRPVRPQPTLWLTWGRWLTRNRWPAAIVGVVAMLVLAVPVQRFQGGLPDGKWYPSNLEAARATQVLAHMHQSGLGFPFQLLVTRDDGSPLLAPAGIAALVRLSRDLRAHPEVQDVVGPVDLPGGPRGLLPNLLFFSAPQAALKAHPAIGAFFLSRDQRLGLVQLVLNDETQLSGAKRLVALLRKTPTPGLKVRIGGLAAGELDLEERQRAYVPMELGWVFVTTFIVLFLAFRSILVPIKAILLNLLAVGAAMGLIVRVFQDGQGGQWVGLAAGLGSVPITLPLLIFCLTFGLSMDYEIFMLARVREARNASENETDAIAEGLAATGGVVTAAAGIMVVVFGAFMGAEMVLVKILGFGLAIAIGLDATLIRGVVAPALLAIAGRWNWWPGDSVKPSDSALPGDRPKPEDSFLSGDPPLP